MAIRGGSPAVFRAGTGAATGEPGHTARNKLLSLIWLCNVIPRPEPLSAQRDAITARADLLDKALPHFLIAFLASDFNARKLGFINSGFNAAKGKENERQLSRYPRGDRICPN